jgi:hypothetical protein
MGQDKAVQRIQAFAKRGLAGRATERPEAGDTRVSVNRQAITT